jgi:hypothetical protein
MKRAPAPAPFAVHPFMERLRALRSTNRAAFDSLSPATKLTLAKYEANKRAAEQAAQLEEQHR